WIDQAELRVGDSLREKIDEGLAQSQFGILVISKDFLRKRWPARELSALLALEEGGTRLLLPVWHGVGRLEVAQHSPLLADRLAAGPARVLSHLSTSLFPHLSPPPH